MPLNHRDEHLAVAEPGKHLVAVAALLAFEQEIIFGDFLGKIVKIARPGDIAYGRKRMVSVVTRCWPSINWNAELLPGSRGSRVQTSGPRK